MPDAIAYLFCAAIGALLVRYAGPAVALLQRLNEWSYRRLPLAIGGPLRKHSDRWHGAMYVLIALGGMMFVVVGVIGFVLSV
jgi:hypothetical protein